MRSNNYIKAFLNKGFDSNTFRDSYYLKTELIDYCRYNGISTCGSKGEITERIAVFLESGNALPAAKITRKTTKVTAINEETKIEANIICSQKHRDFFKRFIGKSFSFNVSFQKWLQNNAGKTYNEAITAYYRLREEKKRKKTIIGKQFEYNNYIREFYAENQGKSLKEAIICWNYKKKLPGDNHYDNTDLIALDKISIINT